MEGDEGLSAFHPFSEERRISGTAGEIILMHSKTDLHIWRGSVFAWEMYEGVFLLLVSLDCARHEHGTENHPLCGWKINGYTNKKITIRFI